MKNTLLPRGWFACIKLASAQTPVLMPSRCSRTLKRADLSHTCSWIACRQLASDQTPVLMPPPSHLKALSPVVPEGPQVEHTATGDEEVHVGDERVEDGDDVAKLRAGGVQLGRVGLG